MGQMGISIRIVKVHVMSVGPEVNGSAQELPMVDSTIHSAEPTE